jgi:hypothetical protein
MKEQRLVERRLEQRGYNNEIKAKQKLTATEVRNDSCFTRSDSALGQ